MQKILVLFPLSLAFNEKEEIRNEDTRNAFNVHCEYNEIIPYLFLRMNSLDAIFIDKNQA